MTEKTLEELKRELSSPELYLAKVREFVEKKDYGAAWCYLEFAKGLGHALENPTAREETSRLEEEVRGKMADEFTDLALKYHLQPTRENFPALFTEHSPSWTRYKTLFKEITTQLEELFGESK